MVDAAYADTKKFYPIFNQLLTKHTGIAGVATAQTGLGEGSDFQLHGFMFNGTHKSVYEYAIDPRQVC